MTQLCRGVSATKNSPPSRTKRTLPIKLLRLTHPYHLYRSPIFNQAVPLRQKPVWSISFGLCASFVAGPSLVWSEGPVVLFGRPSSSVRAYAAACGCTDNEEWSAEAPEEVAQRRHYLPLLGMLVLALLFKASPTAALTA